MILATDLVAALEGRFERGEWFLPAEAVLRCGRAWSSPAAADAVAARLLNRREVKRWETHRGQGRIVYQYALP